MRLSTNFFITSACRQGCIEAALTARCGCCSTVIVLRACSSDTSSSTCDRHKAQVGKLQRVIGTLRHNMPVVTLAWVAQSPQSKNRPSNPMKTTPQVPCRPAMFSKCLAPDGSAGIHTGVNQHVRAGVRGGYRIPALVSRVALPHQSPLATIEALDKTGHM